MQRGGVGWRLCPARYQSSPCDRVCLITLLTRTLSRPAPPPLDTPRAPSCRKQIHLSRTFQAAELEHVLAYSDGRDGLLADIHIVSAEEAGRGRKRAGEAAAACPAPPCCACPTRPASHLPHSPSPADTLLLQDIMRGISPKQEVLRDQWPVHLANKIKYHWRPLLSAWAGCEGLWGAGCGAALCAARSAPVAAAAAALPRRPLTPPLPPCPAPAGGLHCPFKPDKYFESYQYARLPAPDRVRALHFLCTIRCDREDIQVGGGVEGADLLRRGNWPAEPRARPRPCKRRASPSPCHPHAAPPRPRGCSCVCWRATRASGPTPSCCWSARRSRRRCAAGG